MGLLDSLFAGGTGGGGLLDFLRNNAMNQQFSGGLQSDQAQYGVPMQALSQVPATPAQNVPQPPMAQPVQAAPNAGPTPAAPPPMPASPTQQGLPPAFGGGGSLLGRIGSPDGLIAKLTGNDSRSVAQQNLKAQYDALVPVLGSQKAMLAVMNPEAGKILLGQALEAKLPEYGVVRKDQFGNEIYGWKDPKNKSITEYNQQASPPAAPSAIPAAPPGVDPKIWRDEQSKRATGDALPANFDDTSKLRTELSKLPSYQNISQAAPIYKSMRDAAGRNTKAADLNLVYGLGKIMDPGSVVREGEIHMANNAQGWQEKLNGVIAQINNEGGLTPAGRQALMAEAHSRMQSYKQMYDQDAERFRGIATRTRANPDDVVHDFGEFQPWVAKSSEPVVIDGYKIKAK
ncbi:hypothetical protein V1290_000059 [Bradyrhizobium sp. AZCC 1578]|uniref:hypothetical protein n=1 Tax=Bradyrhizobium sp. AZCC 1578 TaxID=3117027 RepID=UPI002FF43916